MSDEDKQELHNALREATTQMSQRIDSGTAVDGAVMQFTFLNGKQHYVLVTVEEAKEE